MYGTYLGMYNLYPEEPEELGIRYRDEGPCLVRHASVYRHSESMYVGTWTRLPETPIATAEIMLCMALHFTEMWDVRGVNRHAERPESPSQEFSP